MTKYPFYKIWILKINHLKEMEYKKKMPMFHPIIQGSSSFVQQPQNKKICNMRLFTTELTTYTVNIT
jgi:hypothetical protein